MKIKETFIKGCFVIERPFFRDERGYFSRAFCRKTFEEYGINADFVQSNISENLKKYTLRGLHSQLAPYAENKLVMCTRGRLIDVCVDVRPDSDTYKKYVAEELTEASGKALYVPEGCAHGYLSLENDTQALYFVTCAYEPGSEKCYRFDDPAFSIDWKIPTENMIISEKDKNHKFIEE